MRRSIIPAFACLVGCAGASPRIVVHGQTATLEGLLSGYPLAATTNIRADEVDRTRGASVHLIQVRGGEAPHRHLEHDLVIAVMRGEGDLTLDGVCHALRVGDVALVPRGASHWFVRRGSGPAVALVSFVPPLDAPDSVPEPHVDRSASDR